MDNWTPESEKEPAERPLGFGYSGYDYYGPAPRRDLVRDVIGGCGVVFYLGAAVLLVLALVAGIGVSH